MKPIVAIVGRPNVGKSRLFNRMVGRRRAIVADVPGVTRDRHYAPAEWLGKEFIAVDTGGLDLDPAADLEHAISAQSMSAIEEADAVICLFDAQVHPNPGDKDVVSLLRRISKPVIFAVNKVDEETHEANLATYYEMGMDELFAVSAEHGRGVDDMLDKLLELIPEAQSLCDDDEKPNAITVAGRPNVGKSTLINALAGSNRVVVHEQAGTTRDAIDVEVEFEGKTYTFIDTAGVKRRWGVSERLEKFTAMRSLRTIDRASVVLQLIDATEGITKQDLHLTGFILEQGKGLILLVNKWDLVDMEWAEYKKNIEAALGQMSDVPMFPISAANGLNCLDIFKHLDRMEKALSAKITTPQLNKIVEQALSQHHLPVHKGKQVQIKYAAQTGTHPPTFVLFSNYPAAVPYAYRRYLINKLKQAIGAKGAPVRIICKRK